MVELAGLSAEERPTYWTHEHVVALLDRLRQQISTENTVEDIEVASSVVKGLAEETRMLRAALGEVLSRAVRDSAGNTGITVGGPARLAMAIADCGIDSPPSEADAVFLRSRWPSAAQALDQWDR